MQKVASLRAENEAAQSKLERELQNTKQGYADQLAGLRAENEAKLKAERAAFDAGLARERLGAEEKAAKQPWGQQCGQK